METRHLRASVLFLYGLLLAPWALTAAAAQGRPNIVLIEVDDLTYTYAGAFGSKTAITPNIDRLADEGVLFANAMCQGMMCGPSRNCLITGKYPHQYGFYRNGMMRSLPENAWTVSAALQRAGYHTAWIGKSHLKPYGQTRKQDTMAEQFGFDHVMHTLGRAMLRGKAGESPNPYMAHLEARGLLDQYRADTKAKRNTTLPEDDYLDGFFTRNAVDHINAHDGRKPLFLWINYSLPHGPHDVPDAYHAPFADKPMPGTSKPTNYVHPPSLIPDTKPVKSEEDAVKTQRAYHAAVHFVDRQVGRVLEALTRKGIMDKTVVVFFSDHGIFMGAHGLTHKGTLFRQITNPSLIILGPKPFLRGRREPQAVELTDLLPTLLELAGAPRAEQSPHGVSLLPVLTGKGRADRTYAFAEIRDWVVAADERYRLIRSLEDGSALLFDEVTDTENLTNIADDHPDVVRKMTAAIEAWIKKTGEPLPPKSF